MVVTKVQAAISRCCQRTQVEFKIAPSPDRGAVQKKDANDKILWFIPAQDRDEGCLCPCERDLHSNALWCDRDTVLSYKRLDSTKDSNHLNHILLAFS
jgi:hypothetical protein